MTLQELVAAKAGERAIQAYIKDHLHLLGDACTPSSIAGEYIAFSQFPIMDGKPDFVVFTSRSRMEVVIVEIKGADFDFITAEGRVHADVNEAAQQVRERFGHIIRNYEFFRRKFHEMRALVEGGDQIYSSLLGPKKYLEVDPNKEVWLKGMVIAGRSSKNAQESRIRHELEMENPRISYDTWDGWIKNNGYYAEELRTNFPTETE